MDVTCTVDLGGLEEKLIQLGPKLARTHLRKALKQAAQLIEADAKSRAPVDTGELRESIKTLTAINSDKQSGKASVGPTFSAALIRSGKSTSNSPGVYAFWVEFGVKSKPNYPKQPFLRPAFDAQANAVVEKFAEVLKEGLEEAAKS